MKRALAFLLIATALCRCSPEQTAITKEEALAVIDQFDDGWRNKNLKQVDSALAPVYTYFTQSGGTFSRDSVVATAGEFDYVLHNMSRGEIDIRLYGNTAVVSSRWKGKGTYRGSPFDEDQRCSIVIIKRNNKVEILSEHCTPIKTKRIFH